MNKSLLSVTLLALLCPTVYAANTQATPPTTQPAPSSSAQPPAPTINCKYRIPASTKAVDETIVSRWAENAVVQSFDFNDTNMDKQFVTLKPCYTDQGWKGFNDALQQSGNIGAIKSQHLTVSSQIDGTLVVNPVKENQWKITLPLQVVYQNTKERLTQQLSVELFVGRKASGDLGIMQMIAAPRQAAPVTAACSTCGGSK